ncbi:PfkB family carbohydrate kinase [Streptomyces lincolnensis]|uniref:PfkB family carbohydrate kinase n=1 Tax=Streptomyces lincolnensis TaxID=1915 RepID=A0A1B1M4Z2_STRLN|nr:sugar kinase [Streptomyces lincolnensis]ANS63462.1 PfkB family carbohydrate kinase [Streptomyces lincolnensis]AXG52384.1 PfkB family carbohydrate kinase [Streptomyces lincolnensis]
MDPVPSPSPPPAATGPVPVADVVCVGETMAVLSPPDARPLGEQNTLRMAVGGAESNVACGLAGLGHRAAWLSRVGDDPFGRRIMADLAARGVDVSAVETDPEHPTGVYFKDPGPDRTRTYYYRGGSAATRMGPELARDPVLRQARMVHLSGVAAALSDSCARLLRTLLSGPARKPAVSFDVNHRPALWRGADAARSLLVLARCADIVFVGRDEAETLWGTASCDAVADLLSPAPVVVVKDAEHGATSYANGVRTFVPSLPTKVVEPVGAGDAFAAGYLAAVLENRDERSRLRLGHLAAAAALRTRDDVPVMPPRAETDRRLALDDDAWAAAAPR